MKTKLKVFLCIMLATIMLITLTGCGAKDDDKDDKKSKKDSDTNQVENSGNNENFDIGAWNGEVYTNDYLALSFTLPTGWVAATDAEIAKLMQIGEDALADEGKYLSEVAKKSSVYYASAQDGTTGNNIIIMSEKLTVSLDKYINSLKSQLEAYQGMSYKVESEGTAKIASVDYKTITLSESTYGLYQKYYIRELDGNAVGIIMTSTDGEATFSEIEKSFK